MGDPGILLDEIAAARQPPSSGLLFLIFGSTVIFHGKSS